MGTNTFSKLILLLALCLALPVFAQLKSVLPPDAVYRKDLSREATNMINKMYAKSKDKQMISIRQIYTTKTSFSDTKTMLQSHGIFLTNLNKEEALQKMRPVMVGKFGSWWIMLYSPSTFIDSRTKNAVEDTTIVFTRKPVAKKMAPVKQ